MFYRCHNHVLSRVLAETDSAGNIKTVYTYGNELLSLSRQDEYRIYLFDGHGNTRILADMDENITDTYDYDAFGNLIHPTGDTENDYLYCGEQYDSTTGYYYLRARYMNPKSGTFVTMDTYQGAINDPVSLHKYLYANANPVMNIDPTGNFTLSDIVSRESIDNFINNAYTTMGRMYKKTFKILMRNAESYKKVGKGIVDGIINGITYDACGKRFLAGFVNGFVSSFIGSSAGKLIKSSNEHFINLIGTEIGAALGSLTENYLINKDKTWEEMAEDAAKSAAISIIAVVNLEYWDSAIKISNEAGSVARTLILYNERDGVIMKTFFEKLTNSLVAIIGCSL